jgi:hypothetical protein
LIVYNIKAGQNTVLRGLIAEEFARYTLIQRYPLIVLRPIKVLEYLSQNSVQGGHKDFLTNFQQTMDFVGFGPIDESESTIPFSVDEIIAAFFHKQDGLTKYFPSYSNIGGLKGFIIEVKSRTSEHHWKPFQYSFSANQDLMFNKSKNFNFDVILCGVTFAKDWEITVVFTDLRGKILPPDFLRGDQ